MKNIKSSLIFILLFGCAFISCKKGPGEGGNSSITGYIQDSVYNATFLFTVGGHPGQDEDVYIIYGDDISYGDRIKSGPDGKFEFKYLRKGSYRLYVYSDTTASVVDSFGKVVLVKNAEITGKHQTVDIDTFFVKKN